LSPSITWRGLQPLPRSWVSRRRQFRRQIGNAPIAIGLGTPDRLRVASLHRRRQRCALQRGQFRDARERGYARSGLAIEAALAERVAHQWEAAHAFELTRPAPPTAPVPTLIVAGPNPSATIRDWLRQHRPDAVISRCNDVFAAAAALRLRVPRDLGYASLHGDDDAPGVGGILQHRDVMGAAAVDALHGLLHRNHRGPHPSCRAPRTTDPGTRAARSPSPT